MRFVSALVLDKVEIIMVVTAVAVDSDDSVGGVIHDN